MSIIFAANKKRGKIDILTLCVFVGFFFVLLVYNGINSAIDSWIHDFWQNTRIALNRIENKPDLVTKLFPIGSLNKDIVLIVIDDKSMLGVSGLFDNDRGVYAEALRNLKELNPKVVGLDVFFATSSKETQEADQELVEAVAELGNKIVLKAYRRDDRRMTQPFPELTRQSVAAPSYYKNYRDKAIRSVSLVFKTESQKMFLSFQTMLWTKFLDLPLKDIKFDNNYLTFNEEKLVELINSEYMLINYNKPMQRFRKFSFFDLYNGNIPPSEIEDKLVIIGFGNSMTEEKLYTPINGDQFSPVMNAMVLSNLLEKSYLNPSSSWQTYILTFVILVILFFLFSYVTPIVALVITSFINLSILATSLFALMLYNTQVDVVAPVVAATLAFVFMTGKRYYAEYSEKKHIKSAFQHYVTASVVNEILKDPTKLNLHGEERNLTVFFSDIEGFTSLAEGMSPLEVVSLLNEYLTAMTDIIFEFNGLLDKYEGDAIMAVFGAPVDQMDHATRACRCALKNQKVLSKLRDKWHREGKPEIRTRIGINTGVVVVGNMGSTMRFDYTVIGDNVNLAARLETANKIFNSSILVSEETAKLAENSVVSRKIARMKAIGKSIYTDVYEVLADKESDSAQVIEAAYKAKEVFEAANNRLAERDFEGAGKILGIYLKDHDNDLPAKYLYSRVKGYILIPPPADWENVITQEGK